MDTAKEWVKKQWKILLGFFVGLLSVLVIMRKKPDVEEILEQKTESQNKIAEAEEAAKQKMESSLKENLDDFFEKSEEIDVELKARLLEIKDDQDKKIKSILSSDEPNEVIARKLKQILED